MLLKALLTILLAFLLSGYAAAQRGPQPVRLSDGDSFALGKERYRLYGIDAPELHQECVDAKGHSWSCGTRARTELRRIIGTDPVECRIVSIDRFGRNIAVCQAGGRDLAEEMVRAGYATTISRRGDTNPYHAVEAEARAGKRGVWAGRFENPSEWRRANPRDDDGAPPPVTETPRDWLVAKLSDVLRAVRDWLWPQAGR